VSALDGLREALPASARAGGRIARTGAVAFRTAMGIGGLRDGTGPDVRRARAAKLRELLAYVTALHGVDVEIEGIAPEGAAVLASNHVSWLDPLVLGGIVPCVPISKDGVASWPMVGAIARDLGVLFVERGNGRSGMRVLRGASRALGDGLAVLNFPEGTTTTGDGVLPFHPGLLWMAHDAEVPIVPVAISYDRPELAWVGDDSFLPHYLKLAGGTRSRARVRFGEPIAAGAWSASADLACAVRSSVLRLIGS
jgi:1-acyl-sn-glycerol-3-phosphate acyltransferase